MSVYGKHAIINLLGMEKPEDRLFVTPLLADSQITESSIDIRLGSDFIVTKRGALPCIDPSSQDDPRLYQSIHRNNYGEKFFLHPDELVLASTLEYFRLPLNVSGHVTSRSSWGRAGLVIATATVIQPGYKGTITLELLNLGEVPIILYPGISIAQIVFYECVQAQEYDGRFSHSTTTVGSRLEQKKSENDFWINGLKK